MQLALSQSCLRSVEAGQVNLLFHLFHLLLGLLGLFGLQTGHCSGFTSTASA